MTTMISVDIWYPKSIFKSPIAKSSEEPIIGIWLCYIRIYIGGYKSHVMENCLQIDDG